MKQFLSLTLVFAGVVAETETHAELTARFKWFSSAAALPSADMQRRQAGTPAYDHNADLRVMMRAARGRLRFIGDYAVTWVAGDSFAFDDAARLDRRPTEDANRLMNLTRTMDEGSRHLLVHRFDRLAVEYRDPRFAITLGRQAVSWGSGRVFQPMDLFNPFAPTAVDRDYKPGDDILLIERAFDHSALQLLYVARRDARGRAGDDSYAAMWHGFFGASEIELMGARHYRDDLLGMTVKVPLGPALLRSDIVGTRLAQDGDRRVSGIVNIDCAFELFQRTGLVFAEYFHNDFGVDPLTPMLPAPLHDRLSRGELFNVMRDYLAAGATYQWHPLWSQSFAWIGNLNDRSTLVQMSLTYEPSDSARVQVGLVAALGGTGDEFGGIADDDGTTSGGGTRAFIRFLYYW